MRLPRPGRKRHELVIREADIKNVKDFLTRPSLELIAPAGITTRELSRSELLDWSRQIKAMSSGLSRYLAWLPARWHVATKLYAQVRKEDAWLQQQADDGYPANQNELLQHHNTVVHLYKSADMSSRISSKSSLQLYAYAAACGLLPTVSSVSGGWRVMLAGEEFIGVDTDVANELAISWLRTMWAQHQSVLDDLQTECDQLLRTAAVGARTNPELRLEWRALQRELAQAGAQVAQLRLRLDADGLTALDKMLLALRTRSQHLGKPELVSRGMRALVTTAAGAAIAGATGTGVALAGLGVEALLVITSIETGVMLSAVGVVALVRRARKTSRPVLAGQAQVKEISAETWTQRLLADLQQRESEHEQVLDGEPLEQVRSAQLDIEKLLTGSAIALGPADQTRLERVVGEMLPTVVSDFTALALVEERQRQQARSDFAEMVQMIRSDIERLTQIADEAAMRKQGTYKNYLRDALGHSELSLRDDEKPPTKE